MINKKKIAIMLFILGSFQSLLGALYKLNHSSPESSNNMLVFGTLLVVISYILFVWNYFANKKLSAKQ